MRRTPTRLAVARLLLDLEPEKETYGHKVTEATGIRSGSLHSIWKSFVEAGWIAGRWERTDDPDGLRRPARRYWRVVDREALRSFIQPR